MNWIQLTKTEEIEEIKETSGSNPVIIFKHSTHCSNSRTALNRLEKYWIDDEMENVKPYFLDLLSYRDISDIIARDFGVKHESPQLLLIKDGECKFHASHQWINYSDLRNNILKSDTTTSK
jgi:bacillithiol system protein YtxJ